MSENLQNEYEKEAIPTALYKSWSDYSSTEVCVTTEQTKGHSCKGSRINKIFQQEAGSSSGRERVKFLPCYAILSTCA